MSSRYYLKISISEFLHSFVLLAIRIVGMELLAVPVLGSSAACCVRVNHPELRNDHLRRMITPSSSVSFTSRRVADPNTRRHRTTAPRQQ